MISHEEKTVTKETREHSLLISHKDMSTLERGKCHDLGQDKVTICSQGGTSPGRDTSHVTYTTLVI